MYNVIVTFADAKDGYHVYNVGDKFPRDGIMVGEARIKALSTDANALGKPLIVEDKPVVEEEKPKPRRATKKQS